MRDRTRTPRDFSNYNIRELRVFGKALGIRNVSRLAKSDLIAAILERSKTRKGADMTAIHNKQSAKNAVITLIRETQHCTEQISSPLAIIPLKRANCGERATPLSKDIETGAIEVTEVECGGRVRELLLKKYTRHRTLMVQGEHLRGGKQDRILNTSILLDRIGETTIPVSCVERGRWGLTSGSFSSDDTHSISRIRSRVLASVSRSICFDDSFTSDQNSVWDDVTQTIDTTRTWSATERMADVIPAQESKITEYAKKFPLVHGQIGHLAFIGANPVVLEMFASSETYSSYQNKLIRGLIVDANIYSTIHKEAPKRPTLGPEQLGQMVAESDIELAISPGKGLDVRLSGKGYHGSALLNSSVIEHVVIFWQ